MFLFIVLSIAADFISLRGYLFNTDSQVGDIIAAQSPLPPILPKANTIIPLGALSTKSSRKAAKKRAKN